MEQRHRGVLAAVPAGAKTPQSRKKLQKSVTKQQGNAPCRFQSSPVCHAAAFNRCEATGDRQSSQAQHPSRTTSDPTNFRRTGRFYDDEPVFEPLERPRPPPRIPEFSHLATREPERRAVPGTDTPTPSTPGMRRLAKTPTLSIGELERTPRPRNAFGRTSSVDLIAEQYQALLDARHNSMYSDNYSEPALSPQHSDNGEPEPPQLMQRRSFGSLRDESPFGTSTHPAELADASPTSDDGTLVWFQEEAVYFKPFSFSPEPQSPLSPSVARQSSADEGNLSLQICVDLLTRELSSAMAGRPNRSSMGTSALQVWVMIEAYERLRDRLADMSRSEEETRSMALMFDVWLRGLYAIHDSLMERGVAGEDLHRLELGTRGFG